MTPTAKYVKDRVILNNGVHNEIENKNNDPSIKIKTKFIDEMPLVTIRCKPFEILSLFFWFS